MSLETDLISRSVSCLNGSLLVVQKVALKSSIDLSATLKKSLDRAIF